MTGTTSLALRDGALTITLDNAARRNALSLALLRELKDRLEGVAASGAKIVFLAAQGDVFSAGADLADIEGTAADRHYDMAMDEVCAALRALPVPVVALIRGGCIGAAVELVLSCDIRVATPDAYLEVPATRLGLLYKPEALRRMAHRHAHDTLVGLLVLGERQSARRALDAGFLTEMVDEEFLGMRVAALTSAAARTSPEAARLTKVLLTELAEGSADLADWQDRYTALLDSPERLTQVRALKERLANTMKENLG